MDKKKQKRMQMLLNVQHFWQNEGLGMLEASTDLAETVAAFSAALAQLQTAEATLQQNIRTHAENKAEVRTRSEALLTDVARRLAAIGTRQKNTDLLMMRRLHPSTLTRMGKSEFYTCGMYVVSVATRLGAEWETFAGSRERLESLHENLELYLSHDMDGDAAKARHRTAYADLNRLFTELGVLLRRHMDVFAAALELDFPDAYAEYRLSRRVSV